MINVLKDDTKFRGITPQDFDAAKGETCCNFDSKKQAHDWGMAQTLRQ